MADARGHIPSTHSYPCRKHTFVAIRSTWRQTNLHMALPTCSKCNAQQQLGWYAFLMGCIAKPIVSLQNSYYLTIQSRKKGSTWATWLIIKGWNLVYHLWTHRNSVLHESNPKHSPPYLDWIHFVALSRLNTLLDVAPSTKSTIDISPPPLRPFFNDHRTNLNRGSWLSGLDVKQFTSLPLTPSQKMLHYVTGSASRPSIRSISYLSLSYFHLGAGCMPP